MHLGPRISRPKSIRQWLLSEWQQLNEQWPEENNVPSKTLFKLFGLYLVAAVVLFINEFLYSPAWEGVVYLLGNTADTVFNQDLFWLFFISFFYIAPCFLYAKYLLGFSLQEMGLRIKGFRSSIWLYVLGYLIIFPCLLWVSGEADFKEKYPLNTTASTSLGYFIIWELSYGAQFAALEFFFRGVMLFTLVRFYGLKGLPIMVIPYMMIHFYKPGLECLASIIAGFILSWMALKTKSIVAGMLIHISVAWSMDFMSLAQKGQIVSIFST